MFRLAGLGGGTGACLPGALVIFLIGGTSSPLGLTPAAAPFGGPGVFLGLGLGLGLGRAGGGGAGAGVSGWFSVFSFLSSAFSSRGGVFSATQPLPSSDFTTFSSRVDSSPMGIMCPFEFSKLTVTSPS